MEKIKDPTHKSRVDKDLFNPNTFKTVAVILLKYKLYSQCITSMSAEDIIAGFRARGILDNDAISDCLCTLSKHWCMLNSDGTAIGLCPKRPDMSHTHAHFTIQAFDYIWDNTVAIEGEPDYNKYSPTQAEIDRIKDIPGFSNKAQREACNEGSAVGGEGVPADAGSPSAGQHSSSSHEQTVFGPDGNRRGVEIAPGKARFNGSPDVPEHLKSKVKAMYKTDAAYRETSDQTYCCDPYDPCPATPEGLPTLQAIYEWHDTVPYKTGHTICCKNEYGNGYYKRRFRDYERMLENLSHCICAQLRHLIVKFGYHSKDGWVCIEHLVIFVNNGGMYNPLVKDASGMAEGCSSYRDMQKNTNPLHSFRSGLPKHFFLTPHLVYDMVALD